VSENLVPGEIRDERVVEYQLQPQMIVPSAQLIGRADNLRYGAGAPQSPLPPAPPPPAGLGPPQARPGMPASPPPTSRPGWWPC
jgi:hypothetical protein